MEKITLQPTYENIYTVLDLLSKEENDEFSQKLHTTQYEITAIYIYLSTPKKLFIELTPVYESFNMNSYETIFREEQYTALSQFFE